MKTLDRGANPEARRAGPSGEGCPVVPGVYSLDTGKIEWVED
jgi:hypothetical protein